MLHLHRKKVFKLTTGILFLFSLIFFAQSSIAQDLLSDRDLHLYDHDSKPYYFGISLGACIARFQTEFNPKFLGDDSVYTARATNSPGFSLGLSATGRLSDRFLLRFNPQLIFLERDIQYKLKYPNSDGQTDVLKRIESVLVSFPFQVKFQSDRIGNFRVYMMTGVRADIDMASNARAKRAEDLVKIQKNDYGFELGLGFNFFFESFILSPEIKAGFGIPNIHARDPNLIYSNVFDKIQSRMISFTIHIEG